MFEPPNGFGPRPEPVVEFPRWFHRADCSLERSSDGKLFTRQRLVAGEGPPGPEPGPRRATHPGECRERGRREARVFSADGDSGPSGFEGS